MHFTCMKSKQLHPSTAGASGTRRAKQSGEQAEQHDEGRTGESRESRYTMNDVERDNTPADEKRK